jgi:hypothetical protein
MGENRQPSPFRHTVGTQRRSRLDYVKTSVRMPCNTASVRTRSFLSFDVSRKLPPKLARRLAGTFTAGRAGFLLSARVCELRRTD